MFDNNWRHIMLTSYTFWALFALSLVSLAPDVIYWTTGRDTDPAMWTTLQLWVIALGFIGRLIIQTSQGAFKRRLVLAALVLGTLFAASQGMAQTTERSTMSVLVPLVVKWEGEHRCRDGSNLHCAYLDIVGVPTVCFGETKGVAIGDRFTDAECRRKLQRRLSHDFRPGLHRYFSTETKAHRLTASRDAAYVSLAYNVGIRGAGRSTATRRLNAGDVAGGCQALTWWNKAGGRVVRGLARRRADEYRLCMQGLG